MSDSEYLRTGHSLIDPIHPQGPSGALKDRCLLAELSEARPSPADERRKSSMNSLTSQLQRLRFRMS
jgi:hypothetical protein